MNKNLLKIYESFLDDLDKLNQDKVNDEFGEVNGNIYDEHNYILSPDRNPEFFYALCEMCKGIFDDLPSNENGFTQEDLNQITCLFLNRTNENTKSYFENVTSLDELQYFNNLKIIPSWCFFNCEELKSVIFPKNLEILEMFSFGGCISLEELDFPEHLLEINSAAFVTCSSLKKVKINKDIQKIKGSAFTGCPSVKEIIIPEKFKSRIKVIFNNIKLKMTNITYI